MRFRKFIIFPLVALFLTANLSFVAFAKELPAGTNDTAAQKNELSGVIESYEKEIAAKNAQKAALISEKEAHVKLFEDYVGKDVKFDPNNPEYKGAATKYSTDKYNDILAKIKSIDDELKVLADNLSVLKKQQSEAEEDFQIESKRGTVLPGTNLTMKQCESVRLFVNRDIKKAREIIAGRLTFSVSGIVTGGSNSNVPNVLTGRDILGCAIKTGDIKLWMMPFYIRFVLEFVMQLAGLLAVAAIVYGGYEYLFAGISEQSERGKEALKNGIIGLVLIFSAWAIVNILIALVT